LAHDTRYARDVSLGNLVIFGSGETAPALVRVHRTELSRLDNPRGVIIDSPYAFQANADFMSQKLVEFFQVSLQSDFAVAHLGHHEAHDSLARGTFLAHLEQANYVFAGPGSPSYALDAWQQLDLGAVLQSMLTRGATLSFASAAALSLGTRTVPVYEIYKVGHEPAWLAGLNVLELFGIRAAVIPHFDNAEGQNHDTRYCYLGATRLAELESRLDSDEAILGIDEHTALTIDGAAGCFRVEGRGGVTWRTSAAEQFYPAGAEVALSELATSHEIRRPAVNAIVPPTELEALVARALAGGLDGETAVALLAQRAERGRDDTLAATELVPALLAARALARQRGAYDVADAIRDALTGADIEVMDSPDGATWRMK
jgi:cyanophycinase-like exopeptidase